MDGLFKGWYILMRIKDFWRYDGNEMIGRKENKKGLFNRWYKWVDWKKGK